MDRSAIDTIRGYCYQFDKSILEILSLKGNSDIIEVEGIEDVDIESDGELRVVQCKYYEKTSYNHSVIAKPIRLMLKHFSENKKFDGRYHLYGHYKDGQEKLKTPLTLNYLKDHFLSYRKNKILNEEHVKLGLSDSELECFIKKLVLDINAESFEEQLEDVIKCLMEVFSCELEEARHYYYNSAFNIIKELGCNPNDRKISKINFINKLDNSKSLFNIWNYKYNGRKQYLKKIKSDLFPRALNTQPYDRFFILDISSVVFINDIKDCIYSIQKNWSNLSKRASSPYSPFIYIYGNESSLHNAVKSELYSEGLIFSDGYNFKGGSFCVDTILKAKESRDIKFQFIENNSDLLLAIKSSKSKKEVYHFFVDNNEIDINYLASVKEIKLQVNSFVDIKDIVS
ncbi:MAG: hypothetical protein QM504_02930 [Pseudomonadota bacterium]